MGISVPLSGNNEGVTPAQLALKAPLASPVFTGISDFSAGGAYFGTAAAANLLDDYETGTFTPTFSNIGTGTYTTQVGAYTKVGNLVKCTIRLKINVLGTAAGNVVVASFPFTSTADSDSHCSIDTVVGSSWSVAKTDIAGILSPNQTSLTLRFGGAATGAVPNVQHSDLGTGDIIFSISYRTA